MVVPWNARYSFPSQANKAVKITPRIPPKNGATFTPGQVIRLEFPAQGYVNPINTTLAFDVTLQGNNTVGTSEYYRFQNNIQSIFNRVRIMYGSTPLEDIISYNQIVRNLTEWTATNQNNTIDQVSIAEGIGGYTFTNNGATISALTTYGPVNVRQKLIQGVGSGLTGTLKNVPNKSNGAFTATGANYSTRRYQVNLACGLLTQDKLIPVKFMASQLAIELQLETANNCIFGTHVGGSGALPTYGVSNVTLIPEILEFDASYGILYIFFSIINFLDAMFLRGLQEGGVPIKFSSWHTFQFTPSGSQANLQVQERSRSVKALFAVQTAPSGTSPALTVDTHATVNSSAAFASFMSSYQWRIGGR